MRMRSSRVVRASGCQCKSRNSPEPVFVNVYGALGIDSEESIPSAYVAWRAGTTNRVAVPPARKAGNRFLGSLKGLQIRFLGSSHSDIAESDGRQMKQCWIAYIKIKNPKSPPLRCLQMFELFYRGQAALRKMTRDSWKLSASSVASLSGSSFNMKIN